jgi:hypothetical protein
VEKLIVVIFIVTAIVSGLRTTVFPVFTRGAMCERTALAPPAFFHQQQDSHLIPLLFVLHRDKPRF